MLNPPKKLIKTLDLFRLLLLEILQGDKKMKKNISESTFQKCPSGAFIMLKFLTAEKVMNKMPI
jgi:hypothetical protein